MKFQIAETLRRLGTMSLALAIVLAGPPGAAVAQVTVFLPTDGDIKATLALPGDIQRGKDAYAECQTCHRTDASGRATFSIPRLSGQHASVLIKQLMDIRSGGRGNSSPAMPPILKNYSADDKRAVAAYLAQLPAPSTAPTGHSVQLP